MDEEKRCPLHFNHWITPMDKTCHNHTSDVQQRIHNIHCKVLWCANAKRGKERNSDVRNHWPRNKIEEILWMFW